METINKFLSLIFCVCHMYLITKLFCHLHKPKMKKKHWTSLNKIKVLHCKIRCDIINNCKLMNYIISFNDPNLSTKWWLQQMSNQIWDTNNNRLG
jgi:predicted membrane protein